MSSKLEFLINQSDLNFKKSNLKQLNFENSWDEVNKKLQKIFNEN